MPAGSGSKGDLKNPVLEQPEVAKKARKEQCSLKKKRIFNAGGTKRAHQ